MITVQNDWIEYETPARRAAVRGGAACAQRLPVAGEPHRPAVRALAPVPARATPPARRLRLTRRGRFVLVVLPSVLAVTSALVAISGPLGQAQAAPAEQRTVVVGAGDSLWSIAERVAPAADPRDVVARIEQVNGLRGASVDAGARLVVPEEYAR